MPSSVTPSIDSHFGDYIQDIFQSNNRWVRLTIKTFPTTGTYIFLKLFKFDPSVKEFTKVQLLGLSPPEWDALLDPALMQNVRPVIKTNAPHGLKARDATTPELDAFLGDSLVEVYQTEKRLVRVTLNTYETGKKYYFIKVFKTNEAGNYARYQQLTLTDTEWEVLLSCKSSIDQVIQLATQPRTPVMFVPEEVVASTPAKGKRVSKQPPGAPVSKRSRKLKFESAENDLKEMDYLSTPSAQPSKRPRQLTFETSEDYLKDPDITPVVIPGLSEWDDEQTQQFPFYIEESQVY